MEIVSVTLWDALTLVAGLMFIIPRILDQNSKVRYYYCYIAGVTFCSLGAIVVFPFLLLRPGNSFICRFAADLLKHVDKVLGVSWEIRDGHILAKDEGAIICSNHQSMIDVVGIFQVAKLMRKFTAIAKKEMMYMFPTLWLAGTIFIDRSEPAEALKKLEGVSHAIHDKTKLWVYPEGTRNSKGGKLLPFKRGAFKVAILCQAPIIPVVSSPYYFIDDKRRRFRKGKIIMKVLEPIPTKGLTLDNLETLRQHCQNAMSAAYEKLRIEVKSLS